MRRPGVSGEKRMLSFLFPNTPKQRVRRVGGGDPLEKWGWVARGVVPGPNNILIAETAGKTYFISGSLITKLFYSRKKSK